jgi:hypothetical protein
MNPGCLSMRSRGSFYNHTPGDPHSGPSGQQLGQTTCGHDGGQSNGTDPCRPVLYPRPSMTARSPCAPTIPRNLCRMAPHNTDPFADAAGNAKAWTRDLRIGAEKKSDTHRGGGMARVTYRCVRQTPDSPLDTLTETVRVSLESIRCARPRGKRSAPSDTPIRSRGRSGPTSHESPETARAYPFSTTFCLL